MQTFVPDQANSLIVDMVNRDDGSPITFGTITFHLYSESGDNIGKYWDASTGTWEAYETSAGTGTHLADGHWICSIATGAWKSQARYRVYGTPASNDHVPYSEEVLDMAAMIAQVLVTLTGMEKDVVIPSNFRTNFRVT